MVGDILQPTHLLLVLVVALLVLGPKRLPEVGRSLGNGLRDFRSAINLDPGEPAQPHHQTPEYAQSPVQEPLARIKAPVEPEPAGIELAPVDATVVPEPRATQQTRTSDPLA